MNEEQQILNAYKQVLAENAKDQYLPGVYITGKNAVVDNHAADLEDAGGPDNVDGLQKPVEVDLTQKSFKPQKMQKKSKKTKKVYESTINKNMNKTKSSFDKLFEDVMSDDSDLQDLGIEGSADAGDDTSDTIDLSAGNEGEVTVTLDRATAQALHDVLMAALGGGEGEEHEASEGEYEESEEHEGETEGEDEDEDVMPEATEMEELPKHAGHDLTDLKKYKDVGDEKVKPAGGKANTGKVPAVDTGSAGPKYKQGAQKVEGSKLKPGQSFFKA